MDSKLNQALFQRYPSLYREHSLPMSQTCMNWGFSHGSGWFQIVDCLSAALTAHGDAVGLQITARQVKEKFGTLRFYISVGDDLAYGLIDGAALMSEITCETCGAPCVLASNFGYQSVKCALHLRSSLTPEAVDRQGQQMMWGEENASLPLDCLRPVRVLQPGYQRLLESLIDGIKRYRHYNAEVPPVIFELVSTDRGVRIVERGGDETVLGMIRFIELYSGRVDPDSGAALPPGL